MLAAHLGGAGEGDLVHVRVLDERCAGAAVARHDVEHAGRQPRLVRQLREAERRERRELRGLEHHRVSGRERRRDLPRQHQQREVPRDDLADDAHGAVARRTRSSGAAPSPRDDRSAARRAGCRGRASRGSACRCPAISSTASRRECFCTARASAYRCRARAASGSAAHAERAPRAARTAASTSAALPWATRASTSVVAGLMTSNSAPSTGGADRPAIQWPKVRP